ncbi:hypothetical protein GCHA_3653 [Paraglaciecola chathamensis S18K6]|uniref:Uncharacterized protein n=1 Tax=Paraglaciecola chathamensis S18K6 TaxID=1127672 RepID=A0AAV3V4N0_9ALTE|nr:hypothetical protein GCHA_3653 [Paraglaciecola chathamensis S18K6]
MVVLIGWGIAKRKSKEPNAQCHATSRTANTQTPDALCKSTM